MINQRKTEELISKFRDQDVRNKLIIRRFFLSQIQLPTFFRTCLILPGWNYNRCMTELANRKLINFKSTTVAIVEREKDVFDHIYSQAINCPYYRKSKVRLLHCDLEESNFHNMQFQDIDLTCTWKNGFDLLANRLGKQAETHGSLPKYFMFSLSERRGGGLQYSYRCLSELLSILSCKIEKFWWDGTYGSGRRVLSMQTSSTKWIKKYDVKFKEKGRIKSLNLYRYKDTQIMYTALIKYQ